MAGTEPNSLKSFDHSSESAPAQFDIVSHTGKDSTSSDPDYLGNQAELKVATIKLGDWEDTNGGRGKDMRSKDRVHNSEGGNHCIKGYDEQGKRDAHDGEGSAHSGARYVLKGRGQTHSGKEAIQNLQERVQDHGVVDKHGPRVGHAAGSINNDEAYGSDHGSIKDPEPARVTDGHVAHARPGLEPGAPHDHGQHPFEGLDIGEEEHTGPLLDPRRHSKGRYVAIVPSALTGTFVGVAKHDLVAGFVVFGAIAGVAVVGIAGYFGLR